MSASFVTLRRLIANEVEPRSWAPGVTTSAGPAGVVTSSTFAMSGGDTRALDGGWVYFCDGTLIGQERAIAAAGLGVAGGDISVGNPYTAVTPSGASFEVHLRYSVTRAGGTPWAAGYLDWINHALEFLWFEDWISVAGVTGQARYLLDLTAYPWLADRPKDRVLNVYGIRDATTNVRRESTAIWHIDDDAEAPELVFDSGGFNTGDTFYLKVARPCNTRIKIAGVWTDVSASSLNGGQFGLAADSDETHAIPSHVLAYVVMESMNALGARQPAVDGPRWDAKRQEWAAVVRGIKSRRLPRKNDGRLRLQVDGLGGGMMGRGGGLSKGWGGW